MAKKINLEIITPEKIIFKQPVDQITLPTQNGEITVLPDHIPLISLLSAGAVKIIADGKETALAISGGLIQINPQGVKILADTAELAEEIDVKRAEIAHQRALELMKEKEKDDVEYTTLAAKIEKELARMKVARRRHHHNMPGLTDDNK